MLVRLWYLVVGCALHTTKASPTAPIAARDPMVELLGSHEADKVGTLGDSRYCKYWGDDTGFHMDIQFGNKTLDPNNLFQYLMYSMNWVGFSQDANNLTVAPPSYYGMQLTYVQGQSQTFYALEKHIVGNMLHWIGWYMTGAETFAECTGTITNFGKPYASFTIKANPTPSSIVQVSKARRAVGEPVNYDDSVKVHLGRGWHSLNATESAVVRNLITWCGCEALYTWFWVGIGSKEFTSQAFGYNLGVMLEASDWKTNFQASQGLIGLTELMNWEVAQPTFTKVDGHIYVNGTKLINMSVGV